MQNLSILGVLCLVIVVLWVLVDGADSLPEPWDTIAIVTLVLAITGLAGVAGAMVTMNRNEPGRMRRLALAFLASLAVVGVSTGLATLIAGLFGG